MLTRAVRVDPLLYDTLIRRFQSPAEREAEGKKKGYARVLEGSLMRGEERLAKMAGSYGEQPVEQRAINGGGQRAAPSAAADRGAQPEQRPLAFPGGMGDEDISQVPWSKEDGKSRWVTFLRDRFVHGGDDEFDYALVDKNEDLDVLERKDREDQWFDDEDPRWASTSDDGDGGGVVGGDGAIGDEKGHFSTHVERPLNGETGVQDF